MTMNVNRTRVQTEPAGGPFELPWTLISAPWAWMRLTHSCHNTPQRSLLFCENTTEWRESIPRTWWLTINSATLWIPYSPPKNSQKKAIQYSLSLTRLFSLSKAFLRLSTREPVNIRGGTMELKSVLFYCIYLFICFPLDWKAVSRLCGRTASWQDLSHFTLHLPPALSLSRTLRDVRAGEARHPHQAEANWINKEKPRGKDGRINMLIYMNYLFSLLWFTCCCFLSSIVHLLVFSIILPTFVSLTHSPTLSPLLMSRISIPPSPLSLSLSSLPSSPPLPDAYDSRSKCLYLLLFPRFPPTLTLLPHPHGFLQLSHFPLLSPHLFFFFSHCFSSPLLCLSDNCLRRRHFHRCKTNRTGGGCDTHPCHPVTPPLHPAAWNPPIFSSAAAFWNPSFPPSLSSKSPHPLRVALRLVPCSSVTKLLKPPVMTAPIQGSQVPFSNTWCINIKDFEQSCVRLWSFRLFDFWPSHGRDFNRSGGVSEG